MINLDDSYAPEAEAPRFTPGQLVKHRKYNYRGVIVDGDMSCKASEKWYQSNQSQPKKDQPWYHVLVHEAAHVTYAAQSNLLLDESTEPILHPMTGLFFSGFENGQYLRNKVPWNPGEPPENLPPKPPFA